MNISEEVRADSLAKTVRDQVEDLVKSNYPQIKRIMLDEGKESMKISFAVDFEEQLGGAEVRTTISYSKKYKDEREDFCDPNQTVLDFEESE